MRLCCKHRSMCVYQPKPNDLKYDVWRCEKCDRVYLFKTIKIRFYLFDCYKWSNDSSEGDLYNLHYYVLAHSFKDYGCYETTVTWKQGSRYPNKLTENELMTTYFNGIVDSNLANAYIEGYNYYNKISAIM